jgi:ribosome-binding protein aMBF1 (putative translation factor)
VIIPTKRGAKMAKTKNALKILDTMIGDDTELRETVIEATLNARVAQLIYQAREDAGLTQRELAALVGTKQPVIARLEDADYEGHSLSMLQKVAAALGKRLRLSLASPEEEGSLSVRVAPSGASRKNGKKPASLAKSATLSRTIDKKRKRA